MNRFRRFAAIAVLSLASLATIATSPPRGEMEEDFWFAQDSVQLDGVIMNSGATLATWEVQVDLDLAGGGEPTWAVADFEMLATIDGAEEETELRVTIENARELVLPLEYDLLTEQSHELAFGAQIPYTRNTTADLSGCSFQDEVCSWNLRVQVELVRGGPIAVDPTLHLDLEGWGAASPVLESTVGEPVGFDPAT